MSQMWLDALAAATSVVERDEILLRSLRQIDRYYYSEAQKERARDDVEEQLRALADRADRASLASAREELRSKLEGGTICPCCDQHAQLYRWSLYKRAVRMLARLYHVGGTRDFVESKAVKIPGDGGHCSQLRLWGLVEQESDRREDGGKSGWWRVTPLGEAFLRGASIPKYAYVYNGTVLRHDGEQRTIRDIDSNFDWGDHMGMLS